ncbi:YT521-B-like domain-containing protein [Pseudomassariella vexata]|uniref:YT521-B-like domain-domain-containing protein n=1 Tax=Pseudomassariella vexata TaxID=1141098 RepID=A0A1Y2DR02_9PEZI|nr:YT521-B-like domain-containing protein [Pseudomassariella vexata]ORY61536.1 YT521-B-like domain-domain-containing protein [Pseudomassariella vexata]
MIKKTTTAADRPAAPAGRKKPVDKPGATAIRKKASAQPAAPAGRKITARPGRTKANAQAIASYLAPADHDDDTQVNGRSGSINDQNGDAQRIGLLSGNNGQVNRFSATKPADQTSNSPACSDSNLDNRNSLNLSQGAALPGDFSNKDYSLAGFSKYDLNLPADGFNTNEHFDNAFNFCDKTQNSVDLNGGIQAGVNFANQNGNYDLGNLVVDNNFENFVDFDSGAIQGNDAAAVPDLSQLASAFPVNFPHNGQVGNNISFTNPMQNTYVARKNIGEYQDMAGNANCNKTQGLSAICEGSGTNARNRVDFHQNRPGDALAPCNEFRKNAQQASHTHIDNMTSGNVSIVIKAIDSSATINVADVLEDLNLAKDLQDWLKLTDWQNVDHRGLLLSHYQAHIDIQQKEVALKEQEVALAAEKARLLQGFPRAGKEFERGSHNMKPFIEATQESMFTPTPTPTSYHEADDNNRHASPNTYENPDRFQVANSPYGSVETSRSYSDYEVNNERTGISIDRDYTPTDSVEFTPENPNRAHKEAQLNSPGYQDMDHGRSLSPYKHGDETQRTDGPPASPRSGSPDGGRRYREDDRDSFYRNRDNTHYSSHIGRYRSRSPRAPVVSRDLASRIMSPKNGRGSSVFAERREYPDDRASRRSQQSLKIDIGKPGDTRYFVMKSFSAKNIYTSHKERVWATQPKNIDTLTEAFEKCKNVVLFFSANQSHAYQGYAVMESGPSSANPQPSWYKKIRWPLSEPFRLKWICTQDCEDRYFNKLQNRFNDDSPVTRSRDGTEIDSFCGRNMMLTIDRMTGRDAS